jgi:MFS family permease
MRSSAVRLGFWAQAGLLAGPFLSMIDSSVINVALPAMARSLHSSIAGVQWVASAYLLALGLGTPIAAYVAKRWGTERIYALSLFGFTAASGLCALAPTVPVLVTVRILQGAFGALLVPLAMNMLLGGDRARSRMSAAAGMVLFLAPADLAPATGGAGRFDAVGFGLLAAGVVGLSYGAARFRRVAILGCRLHAAPGLRVLGPSHQPPRPGTLPAA